MKRMLFAVVLAVSSAAGFAALTPTEPVRNLDGFTPNECSIGIWVKFGGCGLFSGKATEGSPTGLFDLRLNEEGKPVVTFRALPIEMLGDLVMTGRDTIGKGEWHHYEISLSRNTKVLKLYVDGRFQWENDCLVMRRLQAFAEAKRAPTNDFCGETKGLTVWRAGLESEAILPAGGPDGDPTDTVAKRRHAEKIAANLAAFAGVKGPLALYAVPASSNEPYLPYDRPTIGTMTNVASVVTAPGEQESLSFVAFAREPLTVRSVRVNDLCSKVGRISQKNVDVKIVKRWYRTGGAWIFYHSDRRQRVLTPDLLLNDDKLIEVDEFSRVNRIRLAYPKDVRYVDVTDPFKGHRGWGGENGCPPFEDAKTLQPVEIREAGRNQQFYFTVDVPKDAKPGLYEASVDFETTAGRVPAKLVVRVLDVELPVMPSPYGELDRIYASHMNHYPLRDLAGLARTLPERRALARSIMHSMKTHRMMHATNMFDTDTLAAWGKEEGFYPDRVHGGPFENTPDWKRYYKGVTNELTLADREAGIRAAMRAKYDAGEWFAKTFPHASRQISIYVSESSWYQAQHWVQEERGEPSRRLGHLILSHGMTRNTNWTLDVTDMHAHHAKPADEAMTWRLAGGEMLNYADPFPGPENPMIFRYQVGWEMWRSGLGGDMMHGWLNIRTPFDEWAEDYGGDGNYRHFALVFPQRNGIIYSLCWDGVREAYADLCWLTRLCQLADAYKNSDDFDLKTEARRQLKWVDGNAILGADAEMIRAGAQRRILVMQDAIRRHGAKIPPADRAYAKYRWK